MAPGPSGTTTSAGLRAGASPWSPGPRDPGRPEFRRSPTTSTSTSAPRRTCCPRQTAQRTASGPRPVDRSGGAQGRPLPHLSSSSSTASCSPAASFCRRTADRAYADLATSSITPISPNPELRAQGRARKSAVLCSSGGVLQRLVRPNIPPGACPAECLAGHRPDRSDPCLTDLFPHRRTAAPCAGRDRLRHRVPFGVFPAPDAGVPLGGARAAGGPWQYGAQAYFGILRFRRVPELPSSR